MNNHIYMHENEFHTVKINKMIFSLHIMKGLDEQLEDVIKEKKGKLFL